MGDLRLSLEHMTVLGMRPADIVAAAEQLDVPLISLILDSGPYPLDLASFLVSPALTREISARLAGSPVRFHATEGFLLDGAGDFDRLRRLLDISAALGAERCVAMITDSDAGRRTEHFARLCEMARPHDLQVSLEFVATTPVAALGDALAVVRAAAMDNAAISVDILHLTRSGGSPEDLRVPDLPFGAAQLCDGVADLPRDRWDHEGIAGRLVPGDGDFPIPAFLEALPPGVVVGLETPMGLPRDLTVLLGAARRSVAAARRASDRLR